MSKNTLTIDITGSPQAIKALESLLDDPAAYPAFIARIEATVTAALAEASATTSKNYQVTAYENGLQRRLRQDLAQGKKAS